MDGPIAMDPSGTLASSVSTVAHAFTATTQELIDSALAAALDTTELEQIDPGRAGGFVAIAEQEFRCELRSSTSDDPHGKGAEPQALQARILVQGDASNPDSIRMELTDTKELFFCYLHEVQQADFPSIKDTQKLTCTWPEYTTVILRLLGQTMREGTHFAIFTKNGSSQTGKLWFIMNMEHKFVELLAADFTAASQEVMQQMIGWRYKMQQSKLALMQASLADVYALMRLRNPSLLRQLHGVAQRQPGQAPASPSPKPSGDSTANATLRQTRSRN